MISMWTLLKAISILLLTLPVYAQKAGDVIQQKGNTDIERGKQKFEQIKQDFDVESMDVVRTRDGVTAIEFLDETRVDVTENSKLVIDSFVYDPNKKTGGLSFEAAFGTVRYASGQIAKNSRRNVKIKTPTATIGVRGTDFSMTVDEFGGSTIVLLPSCNTYGHCFVGEISVDSDVGQVILNQAFQATSVPTRMSSPINPVLLDMSEFDILNLLIRRRPVELTEALEKSRAQELGDFLGIDFLQFDGLEKDELALNEAETWSTELDIDFLANAFLVDILDQLNKQLAAQMRSEFEKGKDKLRFGKDEETGIELYDYGSNYKFRRDSGSHIFEADLSKNNTYNINLKQDSMEFYDYRIGESGRNEIDITQIQ